MPKRISAADTVPVRVVIVTMDTHLSSAIGRAQGRLVREIPGLCLTVHAAAQWSGDDDALERCRADIAQGDIVVASMLFLEDHYLPILPALQARRDACDAMVCCMSAGDVTRLTRMGRFDMSAPVAGAAMSNLPMRVSLVTSLADMAQTIASQWSRRAFSAGRIGR